VIIAAQSITLIESRYGEHTGIHLNDGENQAYPVVFPKEVFL
jgi:hypothetical protein